MIKNSSKVLIISLQGLGNNIITAHLINKYLNDNDASLTMLVSNNGSYQILKELFNNQSIDYLIWDESKSHIYNIIFILKNLFRTKYHSAYALFPSVRRENLILRFSRAHKKYMYRIPNENIRSLQFINYSMPLISNLNLNDFEVNARLLNIGDLDEINKKGLEKEKHDIVNIGFHIGGGHESKFWSSKKYFELINQLKKWSDINISVFGGPSEVELTNKFLESLDTNVKKCINKPFGELIYSIKQLDLFIGNDSSLAHLSAYLNVPTMVIWAYTDFNRVYPYGKNNIVVKKDYHCMPCYKFNESYSDVISNCIYDLRCIKDISVSDVFDIIKNINYLENVSCIKNIITKTDGCKIVSLY